MISSASIAIVAYIWIHTNAKLRGPTWSTPGTSNMIKGTQGVLCEAFMIESTAVRLPGATLIYHPNFDTIVPRLFGTDPCFGGLTPRLRSSSFCKAYVPRVLLLFASITLIHAKTSYTI